MKQPPKEARRLVDQHVGDKISREMAASALSASDLSTLLGVSTEKIARYCRGEERVAPDHLFELSRVFEVPLVEFFTAGETMTVH